jgi:hypothetical protein
VNVLTADVAETTEGKRSQDAGPTATDGEVGGRWRPGRDSVAAVAAIALAVLPFVVAVVRGIRRGWQPTGDDAYTAVRAWDLFSDKPPVLGTWSSASTYVGRQINHPGPLHFDLLAIPVRLLGHATGTALGTALVNAASVALAGWLMRRRMGNAGAAMAMGFFALLAWSMGSEMLYEPWSQYAPLWPFALFVVAVWCVVAGDVVALPVMVVAGSVALQTHLSYALLVPGLAALAVGTCVVHVLVRRRRDPDGWPALRRRALRWGLVTLATFLLTWAQPLAENFAGDGEGNLYALAGASDVPTPEPPLDISLRVVGGTLALPPAWFPPSYESPAFHFSGSGPSVLLCTAALLALAAALGWLGWRARARGARAVAAGCATGLVGLGLALASATKAPARFGLTPNYFRWLWPLGMVVWLALALGLVDEVRHRMDRRAERAVATNGTARPRRRWGTLGWTMPGLVLTTVAAAMALPTVDNGVSTPAWADEGATAIDHQVVAAVRERGGGPVLVDLDNHVSVMRIGPPVFYALQAAGEDFVVRDPALVRQLGTARRYDPGEAAWRVVVKGGENAAPDAGEELVAEWHSLNDDELDELAQIEDELAALLREHGLPLTEDAVAIADVVDAGHVVDDMRRLATEDPMTLLDHPLLRNIWNGPTALYFGHPLIATDDIPEDLLDRWATLKERSQLIIRVYMSPL